MIGYQDKRGLFIDGPYFEQKLKQHYKLKNLKKAKMLARGQEWQARNLPDELDMYTRMFSEGNYQVPLGLLGTGWFDRIDRRQVHQIFGELPFTPVLRPEQQAALDKMCECPVGLMNAGTGVGKSYMILKLAAKLRRKTLILVSSSTTLSEMVTKCQTFIGETPLIVGGKKKAKATTNQITVALINSAHKLDLSIYGCILADEVDMMISTEKRQKFWFECSPDYLYGFTATMKVNMQEERLINLFFGNPESSLAGVQIIPEVRQVPTKYRYSGTLTKDVDFSRMLTEISLDHDRNTLIADFIYDTLPQTETKKGILPTKRIEQCYILKDMLAARGIDSLIITSEIGDAEREVIRETVGNATHPIVLIGIASIIGRGYDLPPLQTAYLSYPNRFDQALFQSVGRVLRLAEGKTYARVYDFCDVYEGALRNQADARATAYRKRYGAIVK